jgi:predicted metal-dependent hydrolase
MFNILKIFNQKQTLLPKSIILNSLGKDIDVGVKYSNKAKRISISIRSGVVQLIIANNSYNSGNKFLLEKEAWVRKKLANYALEINTSQNTIPIFGEAYFIQYINSNNRIVEEKDKIIYVYADKAVQKNVLIKFLTKKLLDEISDIITPISKKYNIFFSNIRVMNNKTRWGSCSSKRKLSFNWRLVFIQKDVVRYLIVHELSHIVEMNHSKRFWDLVKEIYPEYEAPKTWLKKNGHKLHQYLDPL